MFTSKFVTTLIFLLVAAPVMACDFDADFDKLGALLGEHRQVHSEYKKHKATCLSTSEQSEVSTGQTKRTNEEMAAFREAQAARERGDTTAACEALAKAQGAVRANLIESKALVAKCSPQ